MTRSTHPRSFYEELYDACFNNKLRTRLHIATDPEGMNTRDEMYVPVAAQIDKQKSYKLSWFLEVRDGELLACSGDLGVSLNSPESVTQLRRMAGKLLQQGRVRLIDVPLLTSDP